MDLPAAPTAEKHHRRLTEINPERIYVEGQMKSMKSYAQELREEVRNKAKNITLGKRDIDMQKSVIIAKNNYEAAQAREDTLRVAINENSKEAKRISIGIHRGEYLSANWQNKFDLLNNIEKRITEIEIEKKSPCAFPFSLLPAHRNSR